MRIRKRFPPPPSSPPPPPSPLPSSSSLFSSSRAAALLVSLSSDPQLNQNLHPNSHDDENHLLAVQNEQQHAKLGDDPPPPRSQAMMIGGANPRWGFLTSIGKEDKIEEDEGWKEEQEEKKKSNIDITTRKGSFNIAAELITSMRYFSPESSSPSPSPSPSSTVVVGRWDEGDKTILPLKKRKGNFQNVIVATSKVAATTSNNNNDYVEEKMKSKTNKKCLLQNGFIKEADHDQEDKNDIKDANVDGKNNHGGSGGCGKKSKRGRVIMEGSRCSRVNGRGWRCCQPTLVGYSLCEHHLGKGRLRSMSSVRNRGRVAAGAASRTNDDHQQRKMGARDDHQTIAPLQENQEMNKDIDDDEVKTKTKASVKKRMKIGVVKARSISSLLGQMDDDNREVAAANNIGGDKHGCEEEYCHV